MEEWHDHSSERERQVSIPELETLARKSARIAAPVFDVQEWFWWDGGIPDETALEMVVLRMLLDCPLGGVRGTGHFHVTRAIVEEHETFEVKLGLGYAIAREPFPDEEAT